MRLFQNSMMWLAAFLAISAASPIDAKPPVETIAVAKTYNDAPFEYRIELLGQRPQFRVYRLTYPSPLVTALPQNNTIPADYYLPNGIDAQGPKYPAVICLHILDGNEPLTELVCSTLAARGIPAISFKLPYYGSRGTSRGPEALAEDPKLFVEAIAQAGCDIRRTIDVLASRPEIDPQRIDIAGISLGGIIAAAAAGAEPRLHRAGLTLAGGDLLEIVHHARETRPLSEMIRKLPPDERAEVERKITEADPLRFAAALRDRARDGRVLMINASRDEVIPHSCTVKLAEALGIADRVVWLEGLGHYTAMAELPRALRMMADFFAQDLPAGAVPPVAKSPSAEPTPLQRLTGLVQQAITLLSTEPAAGQCHVIDVELSATNASGQPIAGRVRFRRGTQGKFALWCQLPEIGEVAVGQEKYPWMLTHEKTLFVGSEKPVAGGNALEYVEPRHMMKLRMLAGIAGSIVLAPEVLRQWISVDDVKTSTSTPTIRIAANDAKQVPGEIRVAFQADGRTPAEIAFHVAGVQGKLRFRAWGSEVASPMLYLPPEGSRVKNVEQADLFHIFSAAINFAAERLETGPFSDPRQPAQLAIVARDPGHHGLLCRSQGKTILMVAGTPQQMGAAQGRLLQPAVQMTAERVVYLVGGGDTLYSGQWFLDRMADIERRTLPHIPPRFLEECDALAKAAGVSQRDGRYANLFPERFHCSGVALRGKATAGGRVLHARVLDYMSEINLQAAAVVTLFMPERHNKWMSLGYAGFIGTVTAMNEKGLAIGEMGGRGEGQWDGLPMSLLLRDVMERADTVDEALAILRAAPRTCEYYYVLSDRSGELRSVRCTPQEMLVLKPGQQHPQLPLVPDDTVLISGEDRAKLLSQRIQSHYGKIDVPGLIEIIKRPVAMGANLHDAIFAPRHWRCGLPTRAAIRPPAMSRMPT